MRFDLIFAGVAASVFLLGSRRDALGTPQPSLSRAELYGTSVDQPVMMSRNFPTSGNESSSRERGRAVASLPHAELHDDRDVARMSLSEDPPSCGSSVQRKYNCSRESCEDLVSGYVNYIKFYECTVEVGEQRTATLVLYFLWLVLLVRMVETNTNHYFCTSLQALTALFKLSPNVAGVTFLAIGNSANAVIAAIAAFDSGVPQTGLGVALGTSIFMATAVVASVSFVADVRLPRRSFLRDLLFLAGAIAYLCVTTLDGVISLPEAIGFLGYYGLYVLAVALSRYFTSWRESEADGKHAHTPVSEDSIDLSLITHPSATAPAAAATLGGASVWASSAALLAGAPKGGFGGESPEEGGGGGGAVGVSIAPLSGGSYESAASEPMSPLAVPSTWTAAYKMQQAQAQIRGDGGGPTSHAPFQLPKYHKVLLLEEALAHIAAHGDSSAAAVTMDHGHRTKVNLAELKSWDADAAGDLVASVASSITSAQASSRSQLSSAAALAVAEEAVEQQRQEHHVPSVVVPVLDVIAVLPEETMHPLAHAFFRLRFCNKRLMHSLEGFVDVLTLPVKVLSHLTIPHIHDLRYRRRLFIINIPFAFAFAGVVMTSERMPFEPSFVGGFPSVAIAFLGGVLVSAVLHFVLPPTPEAVRRHGAYAAADSRGGALFGSKADSRASQSLLSAAASSPTRYGAIIDAKPLPKGALLSAGDAAAVPRSSGVHAGESHAPPRHPFWRRLPWMNLAYTLVVGPGSEPVPKGWTFRFLLFISIVMALCWLFIFTNEIVSVAVCLGKVLGVPDIVMGLTVLAFGNCINDVVAMTTIARDGYPTMAIAGAYAGPMVTVLAGIGVPMILYTTLEPGEPFKIDADTPAIWLTYAMILVTLLATLVVVVLGRWRMTHRFGIFLVLWYCAFIAAVIGVSFLDTNIKLNG